MRHTRLRRRLFFALLTIVWVAGVVVTFLWFRLSEAAGLPDDPVEMAELGDTVFVHLDTLGIPTIRARGELDAWRALGYLHAADRHWQMEFFRRIAAGRLSEVFGERAFATDRFIRTLDVPGVARRQLDALSPDERAILEAYAAGVNRRFAEGRRPPEFQVLGIETEAWTVEASLGIGLVMNLDLSHWRRDLSRYHARAQMPAEKLSWLQPPYPAWGPATLDGLASPPARPPTADSTSTGPAGDRTATGRVARSRPVTAAEAGNPAGEPAWGPLDVLASVSLRSASNAWVVGSTRTATGNPILANDMHLALRAPSIWYLASIGAGDDFEVAGVTLPGLPGVVSGYNRDLAWGVTNGMIDDVDLVLEEVDAAAFRYRHDGSWVDFVVRPETIQVRGAEDPRVVQVRSTLRGPVLSDAFDRLDATMSVLWVPAVRPARPGALIALNRASSVEEFHAAAAAFTQPHLNLVVAAADGRIGYRLAGSIPFRDWDGAWPVAADSAGSGWSGMWPPEAHPAATAPQRDFIVSANNLPMRGLDGEIGDDWPVPFRALRITQALSVRRDWTIESTADLQLDVRSLLADRTIAEAVGAARRTGADSVAELLSAWDRMVVESSEAAPIFYTWFFTLQSLVAADEWAGAPDDALFPTVSMLRVLAEPASPWVDDTTTPGTETLADLSDRAMRTAIDRTDGRRWGDIHKERHAHPLGASRWLQRVFGFSIGPYPAPGGPNTVRPDAYQMWRAVTPGGPEPPFVSEYGPSQRLVVEMTPVGPRGFVGLPTGQSGNPFSEGYRSMNRTWREGELFPLALPSDTDPGASRPDLVIAREPL